MQCLGAIASVTAGFKRNIQLMHKGQPGQAQIHAPTFVQHDAHVLYEMLDKETRGEIAGDDFWGEIRYAQPPAEPELADCRNLFKSSPAL